MSRDLTIRLLGRPQVTVDGASGLQKLTRKYVVQGPRATLAGITDAANPLFLDLGSIDEEFGTYLLINQTLAPSDGSMDKAYLTREYLEFNNKWSSESVSDGGEFRQISRKYAVLKAQHAFGYSGTEWSKHPANSTSYNDPWDYIPEAVKNSEPTDSSYGTGFTWTRKSASIVTNEAGLDVWQVSWFEPIRPTGRPSFSIDSSSSLNSLAREYHITEALADDLSSDTYTTFAIGTEDSENTGYFLVDRQVRASNQTGISTLSVKYLEFNNKWSSESVSDGGEFRQISRKYSVLKAEHAVGYDTTEWNKHPANTDAGYDPWDYIPAAVKNSEPTDSSYGTGFNWTRKSASIVTSESGLDVWQVSWFEPIRPTGRPSFSIDSSSSLNSLTREYHITEALADDISSVTYTTFAIGTEDSENTGYFLVDRQVRASNQTGISTLSVKYLEFNNKWSSESVSDGGEFKQISRKYSVLKAQHATGYGEIEWSKHPANTDSGYDPWDYIPEAVKNSEPIDSSYGTGFKWTRKSASIVTSEGGLDVWQVSWFEPIRPTGRPSFSIDSSSSLNSLTREYHITEALADDLSSDTYTTFAIGTEDSENTGYFLVDRQVRASNQTDISTLIVKYLEFNNKWSSESISDSGPFKQVSRKYPVLKAQHTLGYDATEWGKHPTNSTAYKDPWDYIPAAVKNSEPTDSSYGTGFTWTRKSASIVTSESGLDVWQVSWFEPIRPTGRPAYSIDPRTKLDSITRQYHITQVLADDLDSTVYESTFAIGTEDSENSGFYLVDLQVKPSNQTEISLLTARYTKVTNDALTEAFQQTNDLIRVRKRFAVLRNSNVNLGYGSAWSKHPSQATTYAQDPWEYAPSWVANATPGSRNYTVTNADDSNQHGFADAPQIDGQNLGTYISSHASTGEWLKGYAVMSQAGSGLDIWTVEWVTHAPPYWALSTGQGRQSKTTSVTVLDMDENGMFVSDAISTSGSVSYNTRSMSYVFFVKAAEIPSELAVIRGGSSEFKFVPVVRVDYAVTHWEEEKGLSTSHLREVKKGYVWDGPNSINSTTGGGAAVNLANESGKELVFNWDAEPTKTLSYSLEGSGGSTSTPMLDDDGNPIKVFQKSDYALFNRKLIKSIHGKISWTTPKSSYMVTSASGTFGQTRTQITPIFSHGSEKIWKVAITYVGG